MGSSAKKTCFELILIKPTHYDDAGYPITWLRSHIPSNTLAALYGLGDDCQLRLGVTSRLSSGPNASPAKTAGAHAAAAGAGASQKSSSSRSGPT